MTANQIILKKRGTFILENGKKKYAFEIVELAKEISES